jgi:clan AA aspartic protease (TIGR02281 family)
LRTLRGSARSTPPAAADEPASSAPRARASSKDIVIPVERGRGGWVAEAVINGTVRGRFLVDTGASVCVVTPAVAKALDLEGDGGETVQLQTIAGATRGRATTLASVAVGDAETRDVAAVVHQLEGLDGILGNTFLGRFTMTLDADARRVILRAR